jgi:predicted membrane channel-forming protein YqfA (hemolysin III family)
VEELLVFHLRRQSLLVVCSTSIIPVVGSPASNPFAAHGLLAIYPLLIAGTFTPLFWSFTTTRPLDGFARSFGSIAILCMILTAILFSVQIPKWLSTTMYVTLGWIEGVHDVLVGARSGVGRLFLIGGVTGGGYVCTTRQPNRCRVDLDFMNYGI